MSMEFGNDNEIRGGGGGTMLGMLAGSALNRDRDDGKTTLLAAIVFVIIFIVAILAFAMIFNRDRGNDRVGSGTDYAALLTPLIAAKSMDGNGCKSSEFNQLEIMNKLEAAEDRADSRRTQDQIQQQGQSFMQIGFGLSNQIKDSEKDNLKEFGEIKQQLGVQGQALQQLLTVQNNSAIINGVIQQLTMGMPCAARC